MAEKKDVLALIQSEIEPVAKYGVNQHFKSRYATLSGVIDALRPVLAKYGVRYNQTTDCIDGVMFWSTRIYADGVHIETSTIPFVMPPTANVQQLGSLITYYRRYGLVTAFGIPVTDEDDDGNIAAASPVRDDVNF